MEKLVREIIVNHMIKNELFNNKQFGFISGRSTTLQLLRVMDEWTEILDHGGKIDSIYMGHLTKSHIKDCLRKWKDTKEAKL
jgi:hypothetical protein